VSQHFLFVSGRKERTKTRRTGGKRRNGGKTNNKKVKEGR
jgi:hypothetical protein